MARMQITLLGLMCHSAYYVIGLLLLLRRFKGWNPIGLGFIMNSLDFA